ncbi:hypothetical protein RE6C_00299 [Rhodopirellula europaea 6C]|uniref:Uncharacterized protein n=1 Tax=Rhodopirellula europaea 6C TaxID=1263867 RepID=M2B9Z1_9BACT|nr:hypothetical protein RE6C_00299 [Rhodopirellula europaea 6C]
MVQDPIKRATTQAIRTFNATSTPRRTIHAGDQMIDEKLVKPWIALATPQWITPAATSHQPAKEW